jgi:hypothetical protein
VDSWSYVLLDYAARANQSGLTKCSVAASQMRGGFLYVTITNSYDLPKQKIVASIFPTESP